MCNPVRTGGYLCITPNKYKLLHILTANIGNPVTRQLLLEKLRVCDSNFVDGHTLKHILIITGAVLAFSGIFRSCLPSVSIRALLLIAGILILLLTRLWAWLVRLADHVIHLRDGQIVNYHFY